MKKTISKQPILNFHPHFIVDENAQKKSVVVPYDEWQKIVEILKKSPEIESQNDCVPTEIQQLAELLGNGKNAEAEKLARKVTKRYPRHGIAWKALAVALKNQGKTAQESLEPCKNAAKFLPENAEAHHNLGVLFKELNQFEDAVESYRKAVELRSDYAEAHNNLGYVLLKSNRLEEAVLSYQKAISLRPDYFESHNNLGVVFNELKRFEEAVLSYQKAIMLRPDHCDGHNNLGNILVKLNRFDEAIEAYQKAIKLYPNYPEAHNNCGVAFQKQNQLNESIECYEKAIDSRSDYVEAYNNFGNVLCDLKKYDGAIDKYQKALEICPSYGEAFNGLSTVFAKLSRFVEAKSLYQKAIELRPDSANAHTNYSYLLLLLGEFQEGWSERQWFYSPNCDSQSKPKRPNVPAPEWQGESLEGKTILIFSEQGYGDMIQFIRYAELLKSRGAVVKYGVAKPLANIFKTVPWVDEIVVNGEECSFDYWTFALALPYFFETTLETIPCNVPYFSVDETKSAWWHDWLNQQIPNKHKRVGLVWAGNPAMANDANRSISFSELSAFAGLKNVTFVSLQLGEKAQNELTAGLDGVTIVDASAFIKDFSDSAALLKNLDVLVSVCSAPAHLAGALNLPVWTMISKPFDWRWLLNRNDSPWYPSMRLFRQPEMGDWTSVLNEVKTALDKKVNYD